MNMSYCRFRNTLEDFRDCIQTIYDRESVSDEESKAAIQLMKEAVELVLTEGLISDDLEIDDERIKEIIHEMESNKEY